MLNYDRTLTKTANIAEKAFIEFYNQNNSVTKCFPNNTGVYTSEQNKYAPDCRINKNDNIIIFGEIQGCRDTKENWYSNDAFNYKLPIYKRRLY